MNTHREVTSEESNIDGPKRVAIILFTSHSLLTTTSCNTWSPQVRNVFKLTFVFDFILVYGNRTHRPFMGDKRAIFASS